MRIIKGEKIKQPEHKGKYKVRLDFMIGDADGSAEEIIYVTEGNPDLERFLLFLESCKTVWEYDLKKVPDYNYFGEDWGAGADMSWKDREIHFPWPYEPNSDCPCSFEGYVITYFDENGDECYVTVE